MHKKVGKKSIAWANTLTGIGTIYYDQYKL